MTALEITTDSSGAFEHLDAAPPVRWEPCTAFADAGPVAGVPTCGTCGWLADDHPSVADDAAATCARPVGAVVVTLPTRPTLRRAS